MDNSNTSKNPFGNLGPVSTSKTCSLTVSHSHLRHSTTVLLKSLLCGHVFCQDCISRMFQTQNIAPCPYTEAISKQKCIISDLEQYDFIPLDSLDEIFRLERSLRAKIYKELKPTKDLFESTAKYHEFLEVMEQVIYSLANGQKAALCYKMLTDLKNHIEERRKQKKQDTVPVSTIYSQHQNIYSSTLPRAKIVELIMEPPENPDFSVSGFSNSTIKIFGTKSFSFVDLLFFCSVGDVHDSSPHNSQHTP